SVLGGADQTKRKMAIARTKPQTNSTPAVVPWLIPKISLSVFSVSLLLPATGVDTAELWLDASSVFMGPQRRLMPFARQGQNPGAPAAPRMESIRTLSSNLETLAPGTSQVQPRFGFGQAGPCRRRSSTVRP